MSGGKSMEHEISRKKVVPGDRLASIEEFDSGNGAVVTGEYIVSTMVGEVSRDMKSRIVSVKPAMTRAGLPESGDIVEGIVQSAQPSIAQIRIDSINGIPSQRDFVGMLSLRDDRRRRTSSPIKPGDVVRAKVISTVNSIFHLAIDSAETGVLFTVCSNCGGNVIALGSDRVKCRECGWVDDRLLSEEFVKLSRSLTTA